MYVNMYRKVVKGRPGHMVYGTPIAVMGSITVIKNITDPIRAMGFADHMGPGYYCKNVFL